MRAAASLAGALALTVLASLPAPAGASCIPDAAELRFPKAEAAFVATLVERRGTDRLVFDVREVLAGAAPARVEVREEHPRSTAALNAEPGEEVGLVARRREGETLVSNGCLRTSPAELRAIARRAEACRPRRREPARPIRARGSETVGPRVVLGCARLSGGRRVRLSGSRTRSPYGPSLSSVCVDLLDLATGDLSECAGAIARATVRIDRRFAVASRPTILTGSVRPSVRAVVVHSTDAQGRRRTRRGAVLAVTDPGILRGLRLRRPFARFATELPAGARRVVVEARDGRGRLLGRDRVAGPRSRR